MPRGRLCCATLKQLTPASLPQLCIDFFHGFSQLVHFHICFHTYSLHVDTQSYSYCCLPTKALLSHTEESFPTPAVDIYQGRKKMSLDGGADRVGRSEGISKFFMCTF